MKPTTIPWKDATHTITLRIQTPPLLGTRMRIVRLCLWVARRVCPVRVAVECNLDAVDARANQLARHHYRCTRCGRVNDWGMPANRPDPTCGFCDTPHSCVVEDRGDVHMVPSAATSTPPGALRRKNDPYERRPGRPFTVFPAHFRGIRGYAPRPNPCPPVQSTSAPPLHTS